MMKKSQVVTVTVEQTILQAIQVLDETALGIALLVDADGVFLSTVTDGDMRRQLIAGATLETTLSEFPAHESVVAGEDATPQSLLALMNTHTINQIPVLDAARRPVNIVHRADIHAPILLSTPHLGSEELEFVNEAFRTNWIAPVGPNIDAFEKEMCEFVGVKASCAVSSGTAGLHLGLRLLDVGPGDTVFVSDFTFIASVSPITYQHATPVLIDCEPESWNMSPKALERAFAAAKASGKMPKAVIVVGLYGQSPDMDPILEICDSYGVPVLEDAAESLGAKYKGKSTGTFGRIGVYSFNGNKIITTSGGGMIVSDDAALMARAKKLSTQAREPEIHYEHVEIGYNYRMSNILAGVGRGQLRVLEDRVARRREINEMYRTGLAQLDGMAFMPEPEWSHSNRWLSCITFDCDPEQNVPGRLTKHLQSELIEVRPLWKPMHMQPVFNGIEFHAHGDGNAAVSRHIFGTGICLPSGSNMTDQDVEIVIDAVKEAAAATLAA